MISIQSRLDAIPDLELKMKNNPIALLKTIQNIMHGSVRVKYH